ncbi:MAG: sodium-dependent transporter [Bacteroidota bacterium]
MANRGGFSSRLGFILAAAGSAVGLGNIWKFPFEVGSGGGAAFVLMYLLFCFILCFPVMVTEVAIGRKTQKNPVGAFNDLGFSNWNIVGKLGIFCGVLILSFYNVIAGWALGYFIEMLMGNFGIGENFGDFTKDLIKVGSYSVVFMVATAYIVSKGVSGGIERAARILMPTLIIMIIGLVIYAMTLPNAMEGVKFYLIPDFGKIWNVGTIGGALRQAFFSLSLGMGALITYGSYLSKKENIITSAAYITLFDVGIAFIAGLMMFPLVAFNNGGDMTNLQSGPGLIFVTLPGIFENIGGVLGVVVGSFFFLLLSFAALTSTVSLLEVPVAYAVDEHNIKRSRAVWLVAGIIFVIGIPSLLGNGAVDFFTSGFKIPAGSSDFLSLAASISDALLMLGGCVIVFFAAYVWKKESLFNEIESGYEGFKGSLLSKLINFGICYFCPALLAILFVIVALSNFAGINLI